MENKEILNKILGYELNELAPSSVYKSELFILSEDEFEILRKHMEVRDIDMAEQDYDTIKIWNIIFKKAIIKK